MACDSRFKRLIDLFTGQAAAVANKPPQILPIDWTPADEAALYSERPIFNTAKEPSMNDLSKTALEQALRISKEDAHNIKQALLSSASGASTVAASYPEDAAKGLAKALVFLDEISRPVGE